MIVRRLARPLLSAVFVSGGIDTLRNPGPRARMAAAVRRARKTATLEARLAARQAARVARQKLAR